MVTLTVLEGCSILEEGSSTTSTTAGDDVAPAPTTPTGSPTPFGSLLPGQCFDTLPAREQEAFAVLVVPCEQPHTFELYDQLVWTDAAGKKANLSVTYPDETTVRTRAEAQCLERFEPWVGASWTQSDFDIQAWWPSSESWARGDRSVLCAVYRYDGERSTGTARESG